MKNSNGTGINGTIKEDVQVQSVDDNYHKVEINSSNCSFLDKISRLISVYRRIKFIYKKSAKMIVIYLLLDIYMSFLLMI